MGCAQEVTSKPAPVDQLKQKVAAYKGPIGEGEKTLNILSWPGYAEDGSLDAAIDWVTPFEKASGCDVLLQTFNSSEEAIQLMQDGGYDVIAAPSNISASFIGLEIVQPINTSLLENFSQLFTDLKDLSLNKLDGQTYGIVNGRSAVLLASNLSTVVNNSNSLASILDINSVYKNRIGLQDSPMSIALAALYLMKSNPDLGITDPYALDRKQFDTVINLLNSQKTINAQYWSNYDENILGFNTGLVDIGSAWQASINSLNSLAAQVRGIIPEEGTTGWVNSWMISNSTKSINCSYQWIDWMISAQTNAQVSEWFGEAPANLNSCGLTANPQHCTLFNANNLEFWKNIYYWNYPTTQCLDGRTEIECINFDEWFLTWTNLRNS